MEEEAQITRERALELAAAAASGSSVIVDCVPAAPETRAACAITLTLADRRLDVLVYIDEDVLAGALARTVAALIEGRDV